MQTEFDKYMNQDGFDSTGGMKNGTVSVILPVRNAERTINRMIRFIRESWKDSWGALEIIVVDNGSSDRTFEMAFRDADLVITGRRIKGIGECLRKAMEKARGDFRLVIEPRRIREINRTPFFLEHLKDSHDLVLGNRFASSKQNGFKGNMIAKLVKRFADERVAPGISDVRSGFYGFTRRCGRFLFDSSRNKGIGTLSEIIGLAKVNKMKIREVSLVDSDSPPVAESMKFLTAIHLITESIRTQSRLENEIEKSTTLSV